MKKIFIFVLLLLLCFVLCSCVTNVDDSDIVITDPTGEGQKGPGDASEEFDIDIEEKTNPVPSKDDVIKWNGFNFASNVVSLAHAVLFSSNVKESASNFDETKNYVTNIENLDAVMLTTNNNKYLSYNANLIANLKELVNLEYRTIEDDTEEFYQYLNNILSWDSITLNIKDFGEITFVFTNDNHILVLNNRVCLSKDQFEHNKLKELENKIIEDYEKIRDPKDHLINFDNIDITDINLDSLRGYDSLDFNDYSSSNLEYQRNYQVTLRIDAYHLLKYNRVTAACFIPSTNLCFDFDKDFINYVAEELVNGRYSDWYFSQNDSVLNINIGDLTEENIIYLKKLMTLGAYISDLKISNNHYYKIVEGESNYLVLEGNNYFDGYAIIDSYEELVESYTCGKFSVKNRDASALIEKYNSDYFKNNRLYITGLAGYKSDSPLALLYNESKVDDYYNINYHLAYTGSFDNSDERNYLVLIDLDREKFNSLENLKFNNEVLRDDIKINISFLDQNYNLVVSSKTIINNDFIKRHISADISYNCYQFYLNQDYENVYNEIAIQDDCDIVAIPVFSENWTRYLTIIPINNLLLSRIIYFDSYFGRVINKNMLSVLSGLNIKEIYNDAALKQKCDSLYFSSYCFVTLDDKEFKQEDITTIGTTLTYASKNAKSYVLDITESIDTRKPYVYTDYKTFIQENPMCDKEALKGTNNDSIWIVIYRSSFAETMNKVNYSLEKMTFFEDEVVLSLQRTYPIYNYDTDYQQLCVDYILINGIQDFQDSFVGKVLKICVDDTYFNNDYYSPITNRDLEIEEYRNRKIYENTIYESDLDCFNVTDTYLENKDKLVFKCSQQVDFGIKVSKIDLDKSDKEYLKKYFGAGYNFDIFHFYLIDMYTNRSEEEFVCCSSGLYTNSYSFLMFTKYRAGKRQIEAYHHYYLVSHNKFQIDHLYGEDTLPRKITIAVGANYNRTLTFTQDGNNYNVNELSSNFVTSYQLDDDERATILDYDNYYIVKRDLLGGEFNQLDLKSFESSDICVLIERTVNYAYEINCSYQLSSYDKLRKILCINRYFDKTNGQNEVHATCFDYIILHGSSGFDIYDYPKDTKVIITDFYK